jgi:SAM-dependent methyltransferase
MPTAQPFDPNPFHQFEQRGWDVAAEHYIDTFGVLTMQTVDPMLDAVGASSGTRLLDVACGPGFVAAAAARRGASAVGVDFSDAMISEATRRYAAIPFERGDASALRFDDAAFDAVVMNFGMLHLAQPDRAIAEAHRVLRPGGRYAFTVRAGPDLAVGFGMVLQSIEKLGVANVGLPEGPAFFRFSDANEVRVSLARAGFGGVEVRSLSLAWRLPSPDALFDAMSRGGVRTAATLRAQAPPVLEAIRAAVRQEVTDNYSVESAYVVPMQAVLASGSR